MKYSEIQIEQIYDLYETFFREYSKSYLDFIVQRLNTERGNEYLLHGFMRRLKSIETCIEDVFKIYPPERTTLLEEDEKHYLEISIQAIILHVYGCLDDLAWIFVAEKALNIPKLKVSLFKKDLQQHLHQTLQDYLNTDNIHKWYVKHSKETRDALNHRIPIYIPPYFVLNSNVEEYKKIEQKLTEEISEQERDILDKKRKSMEMICPVYKHSFGENSPEVYFHYQILLDARTLILIADLFFQTLNSDL